METRPHIKIAVYYPEIEITGAANAVHAAIDNGRISVRAALTVLAYVRPAIIK